MELGHAVQDVVGILVRRDLEYQRSPSRGGNHLQNSLKRLHPCSLARYEDAELLLGVLRRQGTGAAASAYPRRFIVLPQDTALRAVSKETPSSSAICL